MTFVIEGGFWGRLQDLNREAVMPHCLEWLERCGWLDNFRGRPHRGREFADSEVYKLAEAMIRSGVDSPLPELIAAAQEPDGYLNTRWKNARYTDFEWGHELYCYGHLFQAGAVPDSPLRDVAVRAADHVCREFMDSDRYCGHPNVETALVSLYRATRQDRYLEMARRFLERRGTHRLADIEFGRSYYQDNVAIRERTVFEGHAVRALYLACGAVDVAVETSDQSLLDAIIGQFRRTMTARTYLTGGMGSRHFGEAFGEDFELPPDRAYAETCAAVASVMLCQRLGQATGDAGYADLAERTLYNVIAGAVAADGRSFFYTNPLHQRVAVQLEAAVPSPRSSSGLRAPWFEVSCCPTNIARTLASLGSHFASHRTIHHFATGSYDGFSVRTDYPWQGEVSITNERGPRELTVRDRRIFFAGGETVALRLATEPRWTRPDPRIDAVRGCVALEAGPLVYCVESPHEVASVDPRTLSGLAVNGEIWVDGPTPTTAPARLTLIPYHRRAENGPATMRVWLPVDKSVDGS